jgi:hypothetical protein
MYWDGLQLLLQLFLEAQYSVSPIIIRVLGPAELIELLGQVDFP